MLSAASTVVPVQLGPKDVDRDVDVVVVGLGPVGATLAALLGQAGLRVLAVEPSATVYPLPRAAHVDHEAMRIFQSLGITDRLMPHLRPAPDYEFRSAGGKALMRIEREGVVGAGGWPVGFNVYQPGIETELRALLASLPTVQTAYGARFEAVLRNDADGVLARYNTDGRVATARARVLVGCDGATSAVRTALGIALDDHAFDEPWLVLDAKVPDERGFPRQNLQLCDPARPTSFVHMGPGRLRWEFMLKPGEDGAAMQRPESLADLLRPWRELGVVEVERSAVYRFHGLVAHAWRQGRVFLAGDAAHQMPPFMGQGMCSGLRDAANLAWKIEQAVRAGWNDTLMASYRREREPHVRFIIDKAIEMGRLVCTLDPEAARRRDERMLAAPVVGRPQPFPGFATGCLLAGTPGAGEIFPQPVDESVEGSRRLDDVLGAGAWLIVGDAAAPLPAWTAGTAAPLRIVRPAALPSASLRAPVVEWLAARQVAAVLVRPDRQVFGSGEPQRLLGAWTAALLANPLADRSAEPLSSTAAPPVSRPRSPNACQPS